ncbi:MAG: DUF2306 domain-containing protein [Pseudomonadota bacterium]
MMYAPNEAEKSSQYMLSGGSDRVGWCRKSGLSEEAMGCKAVICLSSSCPSARKSSLVRLAGGVDGACGQKSWPISKTARPTTQHLSPSGHELRVKGKPMTDVTASNRRHTNPSSLLRWSGVAWFGVAAFGQFAFIVFIVGYYGVRTAGGDFAGWNDKELITGHVPGDGAGNVMFALHVLLAAVMTLAGVLQLIPALRRRAPAIHRWSGRVFLSLACFLAVGGLWLTWGRGSYLSVVSAVSVSLNGALILMCAAMTLRYAMARRFAAHERWAMRLFMVANGVWFFRVGLMGWVLINQSPRWMNSTLSGPADIALSFGSYLVPLAGLELYSAAKRSGSAAAKIAGAILVLAFTAFMAVGIMGAIMMLWS